LIQQLIRTFAIAETIGKTESFGNEPPEAFLWKACRGIRQGALFKGYPRHTAIKVNVALEQWTSWRTASFAQVDGNREGISPRDRRGDLAGSEFAVGYTPVLGDDSFHRSHHQAESIPTTDWGATVNVLLDHPLAFFALSLLILWLSVQIGAFIRGVRPLPDDEKDDFALVINASLTLLALIIGFTFSMAVSRYDQRKNYEEEEANAIGTEYVRTDLLPASDAAKVRELLIRYLDQRLLFYTTHDSHQLEQVDTETSKLQAEMWSAVKNASAEHPTLPVTLAVSGMNDMLNRQGYTQAAWWNRIPVAAWTLMVFLAICCSLLIGYGARRRKQLLFTVLPFLVSVAFFLIAEIDSPRTGVIRMLPQNPRGFCGVIRWD
jgi:hypothetical protein